MSQHKPKLFIITAVLFILTLACNAPRFHSNNQQSSPTPQPPHQQGQLQPGGSVEGAKGLIVRAQPDSISESIDVEIETTDPPTDKNPLPQNVLTAGPFLRLSASIRTFTPAQSPFTFSLPVDASQVDTEHLALAVLVPGEEIHFQAECLVEDCPDFSPRDTWIPVSGVYHPGSSRFETTLPLLAKEGRTVVLVQSLDYTSPAINVGQSLRPGIPFGGSYKCSSASLLGSVLCPLWDRVLASDHLQGQNAGFQAHCRQFGPSQFSCGNSEEDAVENEISSRHQELQGVGFADPYLGTDSSGDYELEIRPFWQGSSPINQLEACEVANGGAVYGMYTTNTQTIIVCINSDGVVGKTLSTARHEYFHAVQYGYTEFLFSVRKDWVVEGTASASENSLNSFGRDTGRDLHQIDTSLKDNQDFIEYRAQDFWVYLGLLYEQSSAGVNLAYLAEIFSEGGDASAVDVALQNNPNLPLSLTLSEAYWRWARNQFYLQAIHSGVSGPGSQINTEVAAVQQVNLGSSFSPSPSTFQLEPLDSVALELNYSQDPSGTYSRILHVGATHNNIRSEFYELDSSASECLSSGQLTSLQATVPQGVDKTYYVLISNTDPNHSATINLSYESVDIEITQPSENAEFDEGETIKLVGDVQGVCESNNDLPRISWSYPQSSGSPFIFGDTKSGEPIYWDSFCDGTYTITARAMNAQGNFVARDDVTVVVQDPEGSPPPEKCAATIRIERPQHQEAFDREEDVILVASVDSDGTDVNPSDVTWHLEDPNNPVAARGLQASLNASTLSPGKHLIFARYQSALASREFKISEETNSGPTANIQKPADNATIPFQDQDTTVVEFEGYGLDPEDGRLPSDALEWFYFTDGDWQPMGTGENVSESFSLLCGGTSYRVRLWVTDSAGEKAKHTITIYLDAPPC